ncbi:hypothetical protein ACFVX6_40550 [Streptomyces sp. NPDC058289]|uniref:phthiocerol/phthiodiolone dimycocerosyl transferase family protein n=1 Tax=Streptomyces sp. NPDC058289 TaxID=3346425 RepID=UPI0036E96DBD
MTVEFTALPSSVHEPDEAQPPGTSITTCAEERPLTAGETALAVPGTPMITHQTLHGPLDVPALRAAVADLSTLHPVLTARILPGASGYILRRSPAAAAPALRWATWPEVGSGTESAAAPFSVGSPLLRATLHTRSSQSHQLTLALSHAIADGTSFMALHGTLWERYCAHTASLASQLPTPPSALPAPVEEMFTGRFTAQDIADFLRRRAERIDSTACARMAPLAALESGPGHEPGIHLRRTDIPADQLARLTQATRDCGISLHHALCAITLAAIRSQIPGPPHALAMTFMSPVDVRRRAGIPHDRLVMAVAVPDMTVDVTPDAHPLTLGTQISQQFRATVADGSIDRSIAAMPQLLAEAGNAAPMTAFISNVMNRATRALPPDELNAGPLEAYTYAPGPVPAVFFTDLPGQSMAFTLALPRAWYTAAQTNALAQAINRTFTRACR